MKNLARTQALSTSTAPTRVTVFRIKQVLGMAEDARIESAEFSEALTLAWPTDAHFAAYAPVTLPVQGTDRRAVVRLISHAKDGRLSAFDVIDEFETPPRMVAFVGDCDDTEAHKSNTPASEEWRATVRPQIEASGLAYYETRGGYRVLALLSEPFEIKTPENAEQWKAWYVSECDRLERAHGLTLDRACKDWTRLFRLPNVVRDGKEALADVCGDLSVIDCTAADITPERVLRERAALAPVAPVNDRDMRGVLDIVGLLGDPRNWDGRKHHMCLALGGVWYRLMASPSWVTNVIRTWLAPLQGTGCDIAAGVRTALEPRALGSLECGGFEQLAEVMGDPEYAQVIVDATNMVLRPWRSGPRVERAANDSTEPDIRGGDEPDLIVHARDGALFVRCADRSGYRECANGAVLRAVLREEGLDHLLTNADDRGKEKHEANATIIADATVANRIEASFAARGIAWDAENKRVLIGCNPLEVPPVFDADAEAWLRALAGAKYDALVQWLVSTKQVNIERPAAALALIGEHGCGKNVFAIVCAELWGVEGPIEFENAVAKFNEEIALCPIVYEDECATLAARELTTEKFRIIVQNRFRRYEPKGLKRRPLHGAQRFILSANDPGALKFGRNVGPGAIAALGARLLVLDSRERAAEVKACVGRLTMADGDMDRARLRGHFAWVRESAELGAERFHGADPDSSASEAAVLRGIAGAHVALFERVRAVLDGGPTPTTGVGAGLNANVWHHTDGTVWVRRVELASELGGRHTPESISSALEPFRALPHRDLVKVKGKPVRAWCLDPERVRMALD